MADRKIGVTFTADPTDLQRGFSAGSAAAVQFGATVSGGLNQAVSAGSRFTVSAAGVTQSVNGIALAERAHEASAQRFVQSLERQISVLGKTEAELLKMQAAEFGVASRANPLIDQLTASRAALTAQSSALTMGSTKFNQYGISAGQTAAALRGVPAQLTDIVVSLQGGQAPLTVLLQQGGQLKDMFGGVVPAAKALGTALLGLINPYTVAAAAVAALVVTYNQGASESQRFSNALAMTGGFAGVTAGQMQVMASSIGDTVGTQRQAADALAQLAESGQLGGSAFESMGRAAVAANVATGKAVKDTVDEFVQLAKDPVKGIEDLNAKYHFLTDDVYRQIVALDEQGRKTAAAALAQSTYSSAIEGMASKVTQNLGWVERAWKSMGEAASSAMSSVANIGRPETVESELVQVQRQIAQIESSRARAEESAKSGGNRAWDQDAGSNSATNRLKKQQDQELAALRERRSALAEDAQLLSAGAQAQGELAKKIQAGVEWDKSGLELRTKQQKIEAEIAAERQRGLAAGKSESEIAARVAAIRAKNADNGSGDRSVGKADLALDISGIQAQYAALLGAASNAERILDGTRAAALISEKDYYTTKRAFIESNSELQVRALQEENARIAAASQQLGHEKADVAERIGNDRKIADNKAKMAEIQAKASTDTALSTIQETAANTRLRQSYLQAEQAAKDYLETASQRYTRELDGAGRGDVWRDQNAARNQIDDRYQSQRNSLGADLRRNQITQAEYDQYLQIIDDSNQKALALDQDYWKSKLDLQGSWQTGADEALANYLDNASNIAKQTQEAYSGLFDGLTDGLAKFATGSKVNFESIAQSFVQALIKMEIQAAASQIFNSSGSGGGGGGFLGFLGTISGLLGGVSGATAPTGGSAPTTGIGGTKWIPSAKGNVFDTGRLVPFALGASFTNNVVSKPTAFDMGLMGEAGPEAIMPLRRAADGSLGVRGVMAAAQAAQTPAMPRIVINNHGTPQVYETESISRDEIRLLARDEVRQHSPSAVAGALNNGYRPLKTAMSGQFKLEANR